MNEKEELIKKLRSTRTPYTKLGRIEKAIAQDYLQMREAHSKLFQSQRKNKPLTKKQEIQLIILGNQLAAFRMALGILFAQRDEGYQIAFQKMATKFCSKRKIADFYGH